MIYQPANVYPNNNVIDASINNDFTWLFNGDNLSSYRVDIYKLNESTTSYTNTATPTSTVYGGDTVTFTLPANSLQNANDYIWKITEFESNPTMFVVNGKFNTITDSTTFVISTQMTTVQVGMSLYYNNEYRKITSYTSTDGQCTIETAFSKTPAASDTYSVYSPFVTTLNGFYFKTRQRPNVFINSISSDAVDTNGNLKQRQYTFQGAYTQAQNVSIKYHRWTLYNNTTNEVIEQTDDIYNSNIKYTFDGFVSGLTYRVQLEVETQENVQTIAALTFKVLYSSPEVIDSPLAVLEDEYNAVRINYNVVKISNPNINGQYEFIDDTLHLTSGNITYNKVSGKQIKVKDYTIISQFRLEGSKAGHIIGLSNNSGAFNVLALNGVVEDNIPQGRWYLRSIKEINTNDIKIQRLKNKVLPMLQDTNVPDPDSEYLWFDNEIWNLNSKYYIMGEDTLSATYRLIMTPSDIYFQKEDGTLIHKQNIDTGNTYNNFILSSLCYFDYATLLQRTMSETEINDYLNKPFNFEPEYDTLQDTVINATFKNNSLTSSNLETATGELLGYNIYRRAIGEDRLHNIGFASLENQYIEDFMVTNNTSYIWSIVPVFDSELGIAVDTNELFIRFDEWCVNPMRLVDGTSNIYNSDATWKFGLNVEANDLTQNILKTKFEGLSRYPKFSVQKRNYITGGLTAYLAMMTENKIYDEKFIVDNYPEYSPFRNNEYIYNEPASMLNSWNELVASGVEVLIRDLKGHAWRCQIHENSGKIENYGQIFPTTVTFAFTEIGSLDNISVANQRSAD